MARKKDDGGEKPRRTTPFIKKLNNALIKADMSPTLQPSGNCLSFFFQGGKVDFLPKSVKVPSLTVCIEDYGNYIEFVAFPARQCNENGNSFTAKAIKIPKRKLKDVGFFLVMAVKNAATIHIRFDYEDGYWGLASPLHMDAVKAMPEKNFAQIFISCLIKHCGVTGICAVHAENVINGEDPVEEAIKCSRGLSAIGSKMDVRVAKVDRKSGKVVDPDVEETLEKKSKKKGEDKEKEEKKTNKTSSKKSTTRCKKSKGNYFSNYFDNHHKDEDDDEDDEGFDDLDDFDEDDEDFGDDDQ